MATRTSEAGHITTKFYSIGLSYKKADEKTRGRFSITQENQKLLLEEARNRGNEGLFVLSTCNRTEIIGFARHPYELISLLCAYTHGTVDEFVKVSQIYKDKHAVDHLFRLACGLESQILGDYEIVGQLKEAVVLSKKMGREFFVQ